MARLRIEAAPGELATRGPALVEALAQQLQGEAPALADALRKAVDVAMPHPPDPPSAEFDEPVLRELHQRARQAYAREMGLILSDIDALLRGKPKPET